jgi:regulator of RNase E activity RraA
MKEIFATLNTLSCSGLSDAMDKLGIPCQCSGIVPLSRGFQLAGRAWTVRYGPVGNDPGSVGDYIDDIDENHVVVLDNSTRCDATVWGDILTFTAARRGIRGTVIDGVARDIDRSIELNYPIFARGNWMRTGKDRVRVEAVQVPVSIGGIRVEPGDWLKGDSDGIVVIPQNRVVEVLDTAKLIEAAEEHIRQAVEAGVPLQHARLEYGYHNLQSRQQ